MKGSPSGPEVPVFTIQVPEKNMISECIAFLKFMGGVYSEKMKFQVQLGGKEAKLDYHNAGSVRRLFADGF